MSQIVDAPPPPKEYPELPVVILKHTYIASFPYSALARLCDAIKVPANQVEHRFSEENIMLSDLPAMLWAGLYKHHELDRQTVDDMVDDMKRADVQDLFGKLQDAMVTAFAAGIEDPLKTGKVAPRKK